MARDREADAADETVAPPSPSSSDAAPSARQVELLEAAYRYALAHGLGDLSLRPLASAIGSSPRVLLFLFGSKDGVIRAILRRARIEELELLQMVRGSVPAGPSHLVSAAETIWNWLADPNHQEILRLWVEAYSRSLADPEGPWAGFAHATVEDWLGLLESQQSESERLSRWGAQLPTMVLAVLRGAMLDLLATRDLERVDEAVRSQLRLMGRL